LDKELNILSKNNNKGTSNVNSLENTQRSSPMFKEFGGFSIKAELEAMEAKEKSLQDIIDS
jgi:hypothetical protein